MIKKIISYLFIIASLSFCLEQSAQAKYAATITLASISSACFAKLGIDKTRIQMAEQKINKAYIALRVAKQNRALKPEALQKLENGVKQAEKEYKELCFELGYSSGGYLGDAFFGIGKIVAGTFFGASAVIAFGAETIFS